MRKKALPAISIVGPGRLGSGMVLALRAAGYRIAEVAVRGRAQSARPVRALARKVGARVVPLAAADFTAPVVWITVPDDAIAACAAGISKRGAWKGTVVLHASGALSSTELAPLRRRGALTASLHPMMSFAGGPAAPRLKGVLFAFEGDARAAGAARRIVRDLGGQFFLIAPRAKPLYHAWGSLSSPLVMATLATGELVARRAGIPAATVQRAIRPIVERNRRLHRPADAGGGGDHRPAPGSAAPPAPGARSVCGAPAIGFGPFAGEEAPPHAALAEGRRWKETRAAQGLARVEKMS
jgi:predicted short-subunit dehydrogenase-like oxidoreductase (DUF2520 family)